MSVTRKDLHTLDNGVVAGSLHPLLSQLRLPWEYSVLAACMDPADHGRTHVLVRKQCQHSPQEYVVYRVDPTDGSCHGGQYCGTLDRALIVFRQRLVRLEEAVGERELQAQGLTLGASSADLPPPGWGDMRNADHYGADGYTR